ncbi:ATP-binding cassette domain-containing protein [uncultured Jatrophihabitans sp.]|uniref:ABC transporter permease subunit n=1 Tax=uncultured Jatrophihabitans sp. TaxID=1610747 RepID=UPI0035C969CC
MEFLRYALLGIGTGAVYALLAQGVVLVYRGSGLLNFAQGAMAMVGAYAYYEIAGKHGGSPYLGLVVALVVCAALGAAIHLVVLRPMRRSSSLSRVIATLGIVSVLQSSAFLVFGHDPLQVPNLLPSRPVHITDSLVIGENYIWIFAIGAVLTALMWSVYRHTAFGRATTAVAENEISAAALGHSPDVIASVNWAVGSALAGLAGVLIAPIIFLEPTSLVLLVIPAMTAALVGQFSSFPVTFGVALLLGIASSEIQRYVSQPGWANAAPFIVVVLLLAARGSSLPLRSFVLDRLPAAGSGRVRPVPLLVGVVAVMWLLAISSPDWAVAATTTAAVAIIALSIVVITGYTGQLSLAQSIIAGVAALVAAKFAPHMPFLLALLLAALVTGAIGAAFSLSALRVRGTTLAIATLGLGGAVSSVLLLNPSYTGGIAGITVPVPSLFGWDIDPLAHGNRYAMVTFGALVLLATATANLRRGVTGRRLLAVRSNERAAAALGVSNGYVKMYAFTVGAVIAAVGGILIAFQQSSVEVSQTPTFTVFSGIFLVSVVVAGGVGSVGGALIGALLVSGGLVSQLLNGWSSVNDYLPLIGGVTLVLVLIFGPDGLFETNRRLLVAALSGVTARFARSGAARVAPGDGGRSAPVRVTPLGLQVEDMSVSFGGVQAVRGVSLTVRPGEIHGLIGPNGAGKTTLVDAITGFVRASGSCRVGDRELSRASARRRAQAGMARSFQSLELFSDLTVAENVAVATEGSQWWRWLTDLVWPGRLRLTPVATEALRQFNLLGHVDAKPGSISFGQRKTVAIARSVAAAPSVLLLDEPAAGLDDREADELAELIRHLAKNWGIAILLIEHKIDMIMSLSDRVTVLDRGAVLTSGAPDEVRTHPEVLDAYLGVAHDLAH